jgi:hypothetical protein
VLADIEDNLQNGVMMRQSWCRVNTASPEVYPGNRTMRNLVLIANLSDENRWRVDAPILVY